MRPLLTALAIAALTTVLLWHGAGAQDTGALQVSLQLERHVYEPGTPIPFTVRIENISAEPITVLFPSSQRFDVILRSERGEVSRWSNGMSFAQGLTQQRWAPREVVTFTDAWVPRTTIVPGPAGISSDIVPNGFLSMQALLTGLTVKPVSRPEIIIIGVPTALDTGCTTLVDKPSADIPIGALVQTVEPLNALSSFWQPQPLMEGRFLAFARGPASVNNMQFIRRNVPLTVCVTAPARLTLP